MINPDLSISGQDYMFYSPYRALVIENGLFPLMQLTHSYEALKIWLPTHTHTHRLTQTHTRANTEMCIKWAICLRKCNAKISDQYCLAGVGRETHQWLVGNGSNSLSWPAYVRVCVCVCMYMYQCVFVCETHCCAYANTVVRHSYIQRDTQ